MVGITFVIFMLLVSGGWAAPDMQPGQWEITTTVEMPGMPMKMPPITTKQCLTKENIIPQQTPTGQMGENSPCAIKNVVTKGDKVIWDVVCHGKGHAMMGHGEIAYHGTTMEGEVTMTIDIPGQGKRKMTMHMKGKRIGACIKK